jgi:hypothetical protein
MLLLLLLLGNRLRQGRLASNAPIAETDQRNSKLN